MLFHCNLIVSGTGGGITVGYCAFEFAHQAVATAELERARMSTLYSTLYMVRRIHLASTLQST